MLRVLSFVIVTCLALVAPSLAADTIPVGALLPMTGAVASGGQIGWSGIKVAHSMEPEALGKRVELKLVNTKSDTVEATNAVSRLIEKDRVIASNRSPGLMRLCGR